MRQWGVTKGDTFCVFVTLAQVLSPPPMAFLASCGRVGLQNVTLIAFLSPCTPAKKSPVAAKTGGGPAFVGLVPLNPPAATPHFLLKGRVASVIPAHQRICPAVPNCPKTRCRPSRRRRPGRRRPSKTMTSCADTSSAPSDKTATEYQRAPRLFTVHDPLLWSHFLIASPAASGVPRLSRLQIRSYSSRGNPQREHALNIEDPHVIHEMRDGSRNRGRN